MVSDVHDDYLPNDRSPRRELNLSQIGQTVAAHRRWLILPTLLCFVGSAIAVNVIPPRYTAETKVLLENQDSYLTRSGNSDVQQVPLPDDEAVQSQVQLVSSRDLARDAIKQLGLQGNSEFDPLADGVGALTRMLVMLGLERDPMRIAPEDRILTTYFDRLTVFPVTKSRVLTIEFESKNPDLAARAANTIAGLYLDVQQTTKRDNAKAAAESLRSLIADLRVKSANAEAKAQTFRNESGLLLGANNTTISSQQLGDMSTQLAQARSAEADAQAKARLIRDMVKAGRIADVSDVANSELMRRMSEQRAAVQAEIALQSRTLLPGHPRMQELSAQLADFDRQLRTAAEKAVRGLENDARIAQGRVENLTTAMNAQKQAIGATGSDQVKLSDYDLTAKLLKEQLEFNTAKYQEAVARETSAATPADARIISRAVAPQLPTFPKKLPIIAIMTIAGALLSLGILIARELLSGRAFVESEAAVGLPVSLPAEHEPIHSDDALGLRPSYATVDAQGEPLIDASSPDPVPALLDEVVALRQAGRALRVLVADLDRSSRTDVLAVSLGRALSRSYRAIAIDLVSTDDRKDSSRPALQDLAGFDGRALPGLGELLDGRASFAEVIHRDASSRLHFIPAGSAGEQGIGRDEDGIANVLDALAETYDFVLMSGLPATAETTVAIAGEHADAVVLPAPATLSDEAIEAHKTVFEAVGVPAAAVVVVRAAPRRAPVSQGAAA